MQPKEDFSSVEDPRADSSRRIISSRDPSRQEVNHSPPGSPSSKRRDVQKRHVYDYERKSPPKQQRELVESERSMKRGIEEMEEARLKRESREPREKV